MSVSCKPVSKIHHWPSVRVILHADVYLFFSCDRPKKTEIRD